MAYVNKCQWCNSTYQNGVYSEKLEKGYCSNRCKHNAENAYIQSRPIQNVVKTVEKVVYVDRTSNEEKDQMRASAELLKQRAREIKRKQDKIDQLEREESEKSDKKWILLGLIIIGVALNVSTFGDTEAWIISNLFILFYVIYFFFSKRVKRVGKWIDDKLN